MIRLLIATRNNHKVAEIQALLGGGFRCLTLKDFPNAPEVEEDADTFAGNAAKKALALARWLSHSATESKVGVPAYVLADDSGLEVDALGGAPGVYSARFAAMETGASGNSPDADNNAKLLRLLKDVPLEERTARFRCAIAVVAMQPDGGGTPHLFDGTCEGRINLVPRGQGGFGYDPLFIPTGHEVSFAELGEQVKNQISHRAQALAKLKTGLGW